MQWRSRGVCCCWDSVRWLRTARFESLIYRNEGESSLEFSLIWSLISPYLFFSASTTESEAPCEVGS